MQVQILEQSLMDIFDVDESTVSTVQISKADFAKLVESRSAVQALDGLDIDVIALLETSDHIFDSSSTGDVQQFDRLLSFSEMMQVLIQLRGSNKATVRDIVDLKRFVNK